MFQLIGEREMIELEYPPIHNKSMDLSIEYQLQLMSRKERTRHCVPSDERTHHDLQSCQKGLNLSLLYLDPCVNIQRKEEHAELHHEYVNSKIQIGDNAIQDQVLQLINFKEEKGEPTDSKYTLRY